METASLVFSDLRTGICESPIPQDADHCDILTLSPTGKITIVIETLRGQGYTVDWIRQQFNQSIICVHRR
jgi:hypothetical protein